MANLRAAPSYCAVTFGDDLIHIQDAIYELLINNFLVDAEGVGRYTVTTRTAKENRALKN